MAERDRTLSHAAVPQLDPPADPDEYLFYLIGQCARRREAAMAEAFKSLGMSHAKWRVLTMIYRIDGLTMGELASFDAVDRTTLTRTVDQLCQEGHVRRVDDPNDRRRVRLTLSPSGVALRNASLRMSRATARRAFAEVPDADQAGALRALRALIEAMMDDPRKAQEVLEIRLAPAQPAHA
jgi:DNA-binding MarR family transcriptional regulator